MRLFVFLLAAAAIARAAVPEPVTEEPVVDLAAPPSNLGPAGPVGVAFKFITPGSQVLNNPVVDSNNNLLVALSQKTVYCLNGKSGGQLWAYNLPDNSMVGQPIVASYGYVHIPTTTGVYVLDNTGAFKWSFIDGYTTLLPTTIILDPDIDTTHSVFIAGRTSGTGGILTSVNGQSGVTYWTISTAGPTADALVGSGYVAVAFPGLYTNALSVVVSAFSSTTGAQAWSVTPFSGSVVTMFMFVQDSANNVYVGWESGSVATVYSLSATNGGSTNWHATSSLASPFGYTLAQNLYLATPTAVVALNLQTGATVWTSNVAVSLVEVPTLVVAGEYLYITSGGLLTVHLTAININTGTETWTFADPDSRGVFGPPVFDSNGILYVESFSSTGSSVYAVEPGTGKLVWSYKVKPDTTVYYDTTLAVNNGVLYVGDDAELFAIGQVSSGLSGGAIAGAVIGTLVGVGAIGAAVWWFKFKRPKAGYNDIGGYSYSAK